MITKNKHFSFIENLSFENLSLLFNDLGIMTHPMSNEQKVCIEYPNINLENKLMNVFESSKKDNDTINFDENEISINKQKVKSDINEYTLNISKNNTYTINAKKLYNEFKNIPYSIEEFRNSLKIFISIFNCFNEDLFKWNLEDFNLFNQDNKIQLLNFNKDKSNNINIEKDIEDLYKKHFSIKFDSDNAEIIDEIEKKNSNEINENINK